MYKKGQLTLFIVIGIVLLFSFSVLFFLKERTVKQDIGYASQKQVEFQTQIPAIKSYIKDCLKQESSIALYILGMRGGNINLPLNHLSTNSFDTSYLYLNGTNNLPSIEEIEMQLADYISTNILKCADFSVFKNVEIESGEIGTKVYMDSSNTIFDMNWPLSVKQRDLTSKISSFSVTIPVRFMSIYEIVRDIINTTKKHPEIVDAFYLLDHNVTSIDFVIFNNDTVIYLITDNQSNLIKDKPYQFLFAIKIKVNKSENKAPKLEQIPELVAFEGQLFTYDIDAFDPDDDNLTYSILSALFDINPSNGIINFTPSTYHIGTHFVRVTVKDDEMASDSAIVKFIINQANNSIEVTE